MKSANYMGQKIVTVLCCLLMVSADTLDTSHLQKQHIKRHLSQQLQQQQTQHHHHNQHQHNHHRQHLTKLRQQLLPNIPTDTRRLSRKFDLKTPALTAPTIKNQQNKQENPNSQVELIANVKNILPKNATAPVASTKLRRLSAKDYYNKSVQRRYNNRRSAHNEWAYNTYDVHTNTFGPTQTQTQLNAGKGDDNSDDVEFVSNTDVKPLPDWPRRAYIPAVMPTSAPTRKTTTTSTQPPPLMVPARRGYPMVPFANAGNEPPTTEDPLESNVINRNPTGTDTKDMEKRHICVQQRTVTMPIKSTEIYTRPIWKHVSMPCQPQTHVNQMCTRVQLVHEQAFRDVIRHKSAQQVTYDCCTGWMRESPNADGCMKPICAAPCQNGGTCSGPDTCSCPAGFSGRYCEHDINECKEEKPCDQTCINTVGSYYCKCREGFTLRPDQQSCKKIDLHHDDAFEARDLENEIETQEDITARLQKIEKQLANERVQANELHKTLQSTYSIVDLLKSRLVNLEKQQLDYNRLQTNLYNTESRTLKLEGMLNLLLKCRNGPNAHCP